MEGYLLRAGGFLPVGPQSYYKTKRRLPTVIRKIRLNSQPRQCQPMLDEDHLVTDSLDYCEERISRERERLLREVAAYDKILASVREARAMRGNVSSIPLLKKTSTRECARSTL